MRDRSADVLKEQDSFRPPVVGVTGASGFIGRHLTRVLQDRAGAEIRALRRSNDCLNTSCEPKIVAVDGDLLRPSTLVPLLTPGCVVVNLAYLGSRAKHQNMEAIRNLAAACATAEVKRLIHCSTAAVVGNVPDSEITEKTSCRPLTNYERTKLEIEKALLQQSRDSFELAIVRPTAVFGPGGRNLVKLANDLTNSRWIVRYLKSCLFGDRRMNLVCVENVVSAIEFLIDMDKSVDGEIFIVSDDDSPINSYRELESYLLHRFGLKEYPLRRISLQNTALPFLLRLAGRSNTNPRRIYSDRKLRNAGFKKSVSLEETLRSFADWYESEFLSGRPDIS